MQNRLKLDHKHVSFEKWVNDRLSVYMNDQKSHGVKKGGKIGVIYWVSEWVTEWFKVTRGRSSRNVKIQHNY